MRWTDILHFTDKRRSCHPNRYCILVCYCPILINFSFQAKHGESNVTLFLSISWILYCAFPIPILVLSLHTSSRFAILNLVLKSLLLAGSQVAWWFFSNVYSHTIQKWMKIDYIRRSMTLAGLHWQLMGAMHSLNAIFLLLDTALNNLVSNTQPNQTWHWFKNG